jgi:hypothetical protein
MSRRLHETRAEKVFVSSPSIRQILPGGRWDKDSLAFDNGPKEGLIGDGRFSDSSKDRSADDVDGDRLGDWMISCKKEGNRGAGVCTFREVSISAEQENEGDDCR